MRPVDLTITGKPIQQCEVDQIPNSILLPVPQSSPAGHARAPTQSFRQHSPGNTGSEHENNALQASPVCQARSATFWFGQGHWEKRFDQTPQSISNKRGSHIENPQRAIECQDVTVLQEKFCYRLLYELVGGHKVIEAATERFYQKVLEDEALRDFFGRTDLAHLRSRQVMFINMLLGGGVYTGRDLHVAHAQARNAGLNEAHFDMFLKHFQAALEEVGVRSENAGKIIKFLERKRGTVLNT